MKTELYCIFSLILLTILSGSFYYNTVLVDTQAYVPSVYYVQGEALQDDDIERVRESYAFKRPVEIIVVAMLEPLLGIRQSYSFVNLVFFMLATIIVYYYIKNLFAEKESATLIGYVGAILFAISLPLILYATRVLVDVAGYLTIILGLFAIDWVLKKEENNAAWYHHSALWFLLGFFLLVRDAVIILFPYYVLQIYWKCWQGEKSRSQKLWNSVITLWPILFSVIPELLFMWYFDVGFLLAGKGAAITAGKYSLLGWVKFLIVHCAAFHVGYFFALLGIKHEQEKKRKLFYGLYFFCAFLYLIGIQLVALTSPRFSMVLFPVVLSAAAYGIVFAAEKMHAASRFSVVTIILFFLMIYAVFSFFAAWIYPANTLIPEDAGAITVIDAVIKQTAFKVGGLF